MIYIHNAIVITPKAIIERGAVILDRETIDEVGREDVITRPHGAQSFDAKNNILAPGFIELQINGLLGADFTSEPESIWQAGEYLTRFGVTSFLPTIISSPLECITKAQTVLKNGPPDGYHGARVIGLHLEGPYLNPEKCGAHNPTFLRLPDAETYSRWTPANFIRLVTLAPELPGALNAVKTLASQGVLVSTGHSLADVNQARAGFVAGIRYSTHLFNAMPPLNHRQPGLVAAILENPQISAGLIVDGIHVHPSMVNLAWKILGPLRTNLVTDAVAPMGMSNGEYHLGDRSVFVEHNSARLADGNLAGSLLSLDQAVRNLISFTHCSLSEAVNTVTHVPASLLGLNSTLGHIAPAARADLVLLSPESKVIAVWTGGHQVYPVSN